MGSAQYVRHTDSNPYPNANNDADADSNADTYSCTYPDTYAESQSHPDADSDADSNGADMCLWTIRVDTLCLRIADVAAV